MDRDKKGSVAKDVVTPDRWWSNKRSWTQVEKERGG